MKICLIRKVVLTMLSALCVCTSINAAKWDNNSDKKLPQSSRRVVMMGNSITEYWMYHEVNNHKIFFTQNGALDRGVAGQKTPAMVDRFQRDVIDMHPLVVVIAGGVNDINGGSTPDEVYNNSVKMGEAAVKAGIRPIFASIDPSGWGFDTVNKYIQYNNKIKKYCQDHGYSYCNYFDAVKMSDKQYNEMKPEYRGRKDHSDHLHPCAEGYKVMESVVIPLIETNIWNNGNYEAEYAVKSGSKNLVDVKDGAASKGNAVTISGKADSLHLGFVSGDAKNHNFMVTYKADKNLTLKVIVNGKTYTLALPAANAYTTVPVSVPFKKGYNLIYITTNDNKVTVDKFSLDDATPAVDPDTQFYLYNVGTKQWIKTGGLAKTPDSPALVAEADRTANIILEQEDGTYKICDPEYAPQGWGIQGRNTIYESNNGGVSTRSWGTTLIPGFKFITTGDTDGSVYIEYTWGNWTKGNNAIDDPSGKTYGLYYGDWALGTNGWANNSPNDVAAKGVYSDLAANLSSHGDNAKWIVYPVGNGSVKVLQNPDTQFYIYNVGQSSWIKTGGLAKTPDSPALAAEAERTANVLIEQEDGTYKICDPEFAPQGWGIQGRNTLYESNNGSKNTRSWGTTLIPGFKFVSTGDADGSVYIEYTWSNWTKGNNAIDDPSGKTFALFYGDWALGTNGWSDTGKADVTAKSVYPDFEEKAASHGADAKWLIVPVANGKINKLPAKIVTGITTISNKASEKNGKYYNLQGIEVKSPSKGIYIRNGKKIVVK